MNWVVVSKGIGAFVASVILLGSGSALAIGTITDGAVTFGYTNNFNTTAGNTVDTQFIGAATGDLTWESWWFFRV